MLDSRASVSSLQRLLQTVRGHEKCLERRALGYHVVLAALCGKQEDTRQVWSMELLQSGVCLILSSICREREDIGHVLSVELLQSEYVTLCSSICRPKDMEHVLRVELMFRRVMSLS